MKKGKRKTIKSYCRRCLSNTNQLILFERTDSTDNDEYGIHFSYTYFVLSCAGCETISYRTDHDDIDNVDERGDYYTDTKLFPHTIRNHKTLKQHYYLPKKIRTLYIESLQCISINSKIMAAAAFRAIIEGVCEEEKVKGRDLETKIKNLTTLGLISIHDAKRLHSIRFMGNDAVHRLESVDEKKILLVLQIIEHLLLSLYLLKHSSQKILDLPIDNYGEFKLLLRTFMNGAYWPAPVSIKDILGNSYRRIKANSEEFEKELLAEIKSGKFKHLQSIGKVKVPSLGEVEHYNVMKTLGMLAGLD